MDITETNRLYIKNNLGKNYENIVKNLPKVMEKINNTPSVRDAVLKFAALQDYQYSNKGALDVEKAMQTEKHHLTGDEVDDLLEIYLISRISIPEDTAYYNIIETKKSVLYAAIHDAWSVSRIVSVSVNPSKKYTLIPFAESTNSNNTKGDRKPVEIPVPDKFISGGGKATLQKRRLKQLVPFQDLPNNEKCKDIIPLKTFSIIVLEHYNDIKCIFNMMNTNANNKQQQGGELKFDKFNSSKLLNVIKKVGVPNKNYGEVQCCVDKIYNNLDKQNKNLFDEVIGESSKKRTTFENIINEGICIKSHQNNVKNVQNSCNNTLNSGFAPRKPNSKKEYIGNKKLLNDFIEFILTKINEKQPDEVYSSTQLFKEFQEQNN